MPQYTMHQRMWMIENYNRNYGYGRSGGPSLKMVKRDFETEFLVRSPPDKTILKIVRKFRESGSAENQNKNRSGRKRTIRTNDNHGRIFDKILRSPRKSMRRISSELDLSLTSVRRLVHDLGARSYKIQIFQSLTAQDLVQRSAYCARVFASLSLSISVSRLPQQYMVVR